MDCGKMTSIGSIEAWPSGKSETSPNTMPAKLTVSAATPADASSVVDVISEAFLNDPTWSWAFPDPAARRHWWVHLIDNVLRYPSTFKTNGFETVTVWIPPNGTELTHEGEQQVPDMLRELVGPRASEVAELLHRFEQTHPQSEPHYYLSLLATAVARRGRGLGMVLLKENLVRFDAEQVPTYLESSNPANNQRYESVGFVPIVTFQTPCDGPLVTGMWRKSR